MRPPAGRVCGKRTGNRHGSNHIIAGKADGAENVIRVKATTEGFPGETNFSVICEDGSFYSFNAKYAREPEMLNIEMKDFLENEDTSDFSHTRMNIYFRELGNESPLLVKLIMQSIYKNNDRKVRHLGSKRFGIQFLIKGIGNGTGCGTQLQRGDRDCREKHRPDGVRPAEVHHSG